MNHYVMKFARIYILLHDWLMSPKPPTYMIMKYTSLKRSLFFFNGAKTYQLEGKQILNQTFTQEAARY